MSEPRCDAVNPEGQRCVLALGHAEEHRSWGVSGSQAGPRPVRGGRNLLVGGIVVGLVLLVVGAVRQANVAQDGPGRAEATSRCVPVPAVLLGNIEAGLDGRSLGRAAAVKSRDFENVWMVAAVIEGVGEAGVWGTNDLGGGGLIASVDGYANQFSDWGRLPDASIVSDGAGEARDCVKG